MVFYDSICQYCPDTGIVTREYMVFYQGGPIDHCTHLPGPVAHSSAEIEYNTEVTVGMYIEHFRMLSNGLLNKDPYPVPEQTTLIILDRKSAIFMDNNG